MTACLIVLAVVVGMPASARLSSFSHFKTRGLDKGPQLALSLDSMEHTPVHEAFEELEKVGGGGRGGGGGGGGGDQTSVEL